MRPQQRRYHVRVLGEWPVVCHRLTSDGLLGEPFQAETVDLSAGGMLMVTDERLYRPAKMAAMLDMIEPRLMLRGSVVRAGGRDGRHLCAMRFEPLPASTIFTLSRFVLLQVRERGQASSPVPPGRPDWWHLRIASDQNQSPETAGANAS
jgi:c-di-GMP-binding flagellar brake protein YcgR